VFPAEFLFPDAKGRVPQTTLTVDGGGSISVELPVLGRGVLTKLIVVQLTGTLEGFTYALYNSKNAYPPGADPTAGALEPLYRVSGPVPVASGKALFDGGQGWINDGLSNLFTPFHNVDGDPTNTPNLVYLYIAAAGTGPKTFGVALTVAHPHS